MHLCCLDFQAATLRLSHRTLNVGSILYEESRMWLNGIHRRLAGKVGIRRPYFGEITRSIPYDIFLAMRQVLRDINATEPYCYMAGNKKGEVISLTSLPLLEKVFACLSGQTSKEVKKYLRRKLTGSCRYNHKVKVIMSATKDFGFMYKKNIGQLVIQFYYGEWNYHGHPQHFG